MPRNSPKKQKGHLRHVSGPLGHLQEWCRGKPFLLRIYAKFIALSVDDVHWGIELRRSNAYPPICPIPQDPKVWLRCYRRSHQIQNLLLGLMFKHDEETLRRVLYVGYCFREIAKIPQVVIKAHIEAMTPGELQFEIYHAIWFWRDLEKRLDRLLLDLESDTKPHATAIAAIRLPLFQFFLRVYGPCFMVHGKSPSQLLRAARKGDLEAHEALIRLDPTVGNDKGLLKIRHLSAHSKDAQLANVKLARAEISPPYRPVSEYTLKASSGALIQRLGKALKVPINAGDIRRLYNAIARDRNCRHLNDPTLIAKNDDAFRKELQRAQKEWDKVLPSTTGTPPNQNMSQ